MTSPNATRETAVSDERLTALPGLLRTWAAAYLDARKMQFAKSLVDDAAAACDELLRARSALSPSPAPVTPVSELKPCPFCGASPLEDRIEPHEHSPMLMGLIPIPFSYPGAWSIECVPCGFRIFSHDSRDEAVSKWNRRSALADVGECELCNGTGNAVVDYCADCNGTGKQPRPAAEAKCPASLVESLRALRDGGYLGDHGELQQAVAGAIVYLTSPAAHTAQLTPTQPLIDALEEAISLMGQEARDVWRSAQRNKDEPRDFEQYMDTYHGWVRDTELVAKHVDELRRLAEQGSGAKDAKEGGT